MKYSQVSIPWKEGLHLRTAAKLAKLARSFQSSVSLRYEERLADAQSILAILLLCATFGSVVTLEASGADEDQALAAITNVFAQENTDAAEAREVSGDETSQKPA